MKQVRIEANDQNIHGRIELERSKSISNRVLIIRALCESDFNIKGLAGSDDTATMIRLLKEPKDIFDVGAAGTTMRFLTAFNALMCDKEVIMTGSDRMCNRPIGILVDGLRSIGAAIEYQEKEGFPPLKLSPSSMKGGRVQVDAGTSSQFLSALLLIGPYLKEGLELELIGELVSRPYLEMTLAIMKYFGVHCLWKDNLISIEPQKYVAKEFEVEADWSAASYWYSIAALSQECDLTVLGLQQNSLQGDSAIVEIYQSFGVKTEFIDGGVRLSKGGSVKSHLKYDFLLCPDIVQTVAVTAAALNVTCQFVGVRTLKIKETDRVQALKVELEKFHVDLSVISDDSCAISGQAKSASEFIDTYEDHRMAMSFAPLALAGFPVNMNEPMVVTKSYPAFWKDLSKVGITAVEL